MTKVISNSNVSSNALIASAFKSADNAVKHGNNGVQQMAAGIMLFHAEHHTSERATFDKMAERSEAFKLLKDELVAEFIVKRLTDKSKNDAGQSYTIDQVTRQNRINATQMQALNKGFDLAIALYACGVTSQSFDGTTGLFSVPVTALLPLDENGDRATPIGQLLKLQQADKAVALDGAAYRYTTADDKIAAFTAFPAHVLTVGGYKKVKKSSLANGAQIATSNGATDTVTNGSAPAADVRNNPTSWSFEHACKMLARIALHVTTIAAEGDDKPIPYSEWPADLCNAVTELSVMRDDAIAVDEQRKAAAAA